jgi:hypothetical protein
MKSITRLLGLVATLHLTLPGQAAVIINDSWADGSRGEQSLPTESAWFAATAATLTAAPGALTGTVGGSGASMWTTHFTPVGDPATLHHIGDTLKATLTFTPHNVSIESSTQRGFRLGLYDYSGSTRVSADGFSNSGINAFGVPGYMLNMNFAEHFTISNPAQIMERTELAGGLIGSVANYTSLGTGGGAIGLPGFTSGRQYQLEFVFTRTGADSLQITTTFFGNTAPISHTVADLSGANFAFDTLAIRPASSGSSAEQFVFSNFTVELIPIPEPSVGALLGLAAFGLLFCSEKRGGRFLA